MMLYMYVMLMLTLLPGVASAKENCGAVGSRPDWAECIKRQPIVTKEPAYRSQESEPPHIDGPDVAAYKMLKALRITAEQFDYAVKEAGRWALDACKERASDAAKAKIKVPPEFPNPYPPGHSTRYSEAYWNSVRAGVSAAKAAEPRCKPEAAIAEDKVRKEYAGLARERQECPLRPAPWIGMHISKVAETNWGESGDRPSITETAAGVRTMLDYSWWRRYQDKIRCPNMGHALIFENDILTMILR